MSSVGSIPGAGAGTKPVTFDITEYPVNDFKPSEIMAETLSFMEFAKRHPTWHSFAYCIYAATWHSWVIVSVDARISLSEIRQILNKHIELYGLLTEEVDEIDYPMTMEVVIGR